MPYALADQSTLTSSSVKTRIASIDILRGLVMVIMAIDHVRDFWGVAPFRPEDLTQTSVPLFLTRLITHLCAPTFVFLAGISIFQFGQKRSRKEVSVFLLTRGLWLVAVEIVVFTFLVQWSYQLIVLAVLWVIGWSMILMAALVGLPRKVLAALAIVVVAGHNLLPGIQPVTASNLLPAFLVNSPFVFPLGEGMPTLLVAYTILPWTAVMLAGYVVGYWFTLPVERLNRQLRILGLVLLGIFLVVRAVNVYGDPVPWSVQPRGWIFTVCSFFNVSKYPPSLLFLSLTLGIGVLLLSLFNRHQNRFTAWLQVFGQVPFFYFVLHFAVISAGAYAWTVVAYGKPVNLSFARELPQAYEFHLWRLYLVWALVVAALYFPCRWFGHYRKKHGYWWLSYL